MDAWRRRALGEEGREEDETEDDKYSSKLICFIYIPIK